MGWMDPITLIVAAIAAGVSTGAISALQDDVKEAAKSAYARVRGLVARRVAGNPGAELTLAEYEADPGNWEAPLAAKLKQVGAADDAELVTAAKALMELVDKAGARAGKYNVTITGSTGVQVGDGNTQFNRF
jgi:hypothetical protein